MHSDRVRDGKDVDKLVFLCLGANLGDRQSFIERAIVSLEEGGFAIVRRSSIYETEPVGLTEQPWFLNTVVAGETDLEPRSLLILCKRIEEQAGRERNVRFGPRVIDIDILLYKGSIVDEDSLIIPHPRMHERRFVLEPLLEIAPQINDPNQTVRYADMLAGLDEKKKVTKLKGSEF